MPEPVDAILQANSDSYEWLLQRARTLCAGQREAVMEAVTFAAMFAGNYHPGRFADGALENLAREAGLRLAGTAAAGHVVQSKGRQRRLLHVASRVPAIGGHTRMLRRWIESDRSSRHSLAVLHQGNEKLPEWLARAVISSGGSLTTLAEGELLAKALRLRTLARLGIDQVILHCDGCDVVPAAAFATDEAPPVILLNHADHIFWLGSSVTDHVVSLRSAAAELVAGRRFLTSNSILPIPLLDETGLVTRTQARARLRIDEGQAMLLSVGRGEKYRPCGDYDFVATAHSILERHRTAHLYVVGESEEGIRPYLRRPIHDRLHFVGSMEQPALYHAAADIYLESFPFGSHTALLEAALAGLPVVPAYAPLFPLLVTNEDSLRDLLVNPVSEQAYREEVARLIADPELRIARGRLLRQRLLQRHVGEAWTARVHVLYRHTGQLVHRPRAVPAAHCEFNPHDIGLSRFRVMADGSKGRSGPQDPENDALRHGAYVAKFAGNYAAARRHAWAALKQDIGSRASWRVLTATLLGRHARLARRWMNVA